MTYEEARDYLPHTMERLAKFLAESEIYTGEEYANDIDAIAVAIIALGKQCPKELDYEIDNCTVEDVYRCPVCGKETIFDDDKYCSGCGQKFEEDDADGDEDGEEYD